LITVAPPKAIGAAQETMVKGRTVTTSAPADSAFYVRLVRPARIWAVAAIHGEGKRLAQLHAQLGARLAKGDRLVYLGGYLGHGSDVAGTLDELIAFRRLFLARRLAFLGDVAFLRGAQEEMWQKLQQLQFAPNPREVLQWMLDHGVAATLEAYGGEARLGLAAAREGAMALTRWSAGLRAAVDARPGHRALLTSIKRYALSDDGALLFVHAGVDPGKPLDLQRDALWWPGANILELAEPYGGFRRVIRGFDRRHGGLMESAYAVSIDAGSGFGGPLIAACFTPDGRIIDRLEA
jgi:serine/threonine protein phosphatase 1